MSIYQKLNDTLQPIRIEYSPRVWHNSDFHTGIPTASDIGIPNNKNHN